MLHGFGGHEHVSVARIEFVQTVLTDTASVFSHIQIRTLTAQANGFEDMPVRDCLEVRLRTAVLMGKSR